MKHQIMAWAVVPFILVSVSSCKKDKPSDDPIQQGTADVWLTAGGQQINVKGPCGWASAAGVHYIGSNHETNNLRVFGINFNVENPPAATTTYTLVDNLSGQSDTKAKAYFTEVQGSTITEWSSFDGSGYVTLSVSGKKITVNLTGIELEPYTNNAAPYNVNGTLSGNLTFYRE